MSSNKTQTRLYYITTNAKVGTVVNKLRKVSI